MYEESINLDDLDIEETCYPNTEPLMEDSAIIRCGRYLSVKAKKNALQLTAGCDDSFIMVDDIEPIQKEYICMIANGTSSNDVCKELNIDPFLPLLWKQEADKDGVYMQCLNLVMEKHARDLEEVIRTEAINSPRSALLKMFYMKAWDDKYKDNALPQTNVQTNIQVTISDQQGNARPFVVNTEANVVEEIKRG